MINQRALNVFSYSTTLESLHYLCIWSVITLVCCIGDFETEQVLLEYRGEFWFLLVLWTSCNVLFTTFLSNHYGGVYQFMKVSGDVCDEVVSHSLMSKSAAFLSKLTSVKMNKTSLWCQRLCVLSDVQSGSKSKLCSSGRDAGHRCFGSNKATSERVQERQCGFGQS